MYLFYFIRSPLNDTYLLAKIFEDLPQALYLMFGIYMFTTTCGVDAITILILQVSNQKHKKKC